jgi:hypothetical protein
VLVSPNNSEFCLVENNATINNDNLWELPVNDLGAVHIFVPNYTPIAVTSIPSAVFVACSHHLQFCCDLLFPSINSLSHFFSALKLRVDQNSGNLAGFSFMVMDDFCLSSQLE